MDGRDSPSRRPRRQSESRPKLDTRSKPAPYDPVRQHLQNIASTTINALNNGFVDEPTAPNITYRHDIRRFIESLQQHTKFYPDDSRELRNWRTPPPVRISGGAAQTPGLHIDIIECSTLVGARRLREQIPQDKIGVLNFASATKPGGGFINGARAQEESIARSSSLYISLTTKAAEPFYDTHRRDDKHGYYTHAMIHSPNVVLFRDDDGRWLAPIRVDIVTSPAVNAGLVRKSSRRPRDEVEGRIQEVMKERMARILTVFERQSVRNLVLGSFGTGVFQNDVPAMAELWRELLMVPNARFSRSFDRVVFAIPDRLTVSKFESGFYPHHGSGL